MGVSVWDMNVPMKGVGGECFQAFLSILMLFRAELILNASECIVCMSEIYEISNKIECNIQDQFNGFEVTDRGFQTRMVYLKVVI